MIEEKVECKRLGYEYKNLFAKLTYFIHHTPFAKDFISNNDLKMLSDLDLFLNTGKYEIIEFGTHKTRFDSSDIIQTQKEEIERLNNIIDELDNLISIKIVREANEFDYHIDINDMVEIKLKLKALKEGKDNENNNV